MQTTTIKIRLTKDTKNAIESFVFGRYVSVSEFLRQAAKEKLEREAVNHAEGKKIADNG